MDDASLFPAALADGTRIDAVVLERAIGQGAWGIVYEGRHDKWGRVAVKEFFPSSYAVRSPRGSLGSTAPQWQDAVRRGMERFAQEGIALRAIRHENVVPVLDYLEANNSAYLVMEFIEGTTLERAMKDDRFDNPEAVIGLGATLVDTLHAIHAKNILHRDIAPDNIMIRPDGTPVLIDFGGAAAAIATATRSTQNIVKEGYSPPEQYDTSANPAFPVGPWSDIYATAAVLYVLSSGREPPISNSRLLSTGVRGGSDPLTPLSALSPPGYSKAWLAAVDRALALLPNDRPESAIAWRRQFEERKPVSRLPLVLASARNRALLATAAVVAVGGAAFGFAGLNASRSVPATLAVATPRPQPAVRSRPAARPTHHPVARPAPKPTLRPTPRPEPTLHPTPVPAQQTIARPAPVKPAPRPQLVDVPPPVRTYVPPVATQPQTQTYAAPEPEPATDPIVGAWRWFHGDTVTFFANGGVRSSIGVSGLWQRSGDTYTITWNWGGQGVANYIDTIRITSGGTSVQGQNNTGSPVSGTRL